MHNSSQAENPIPLDRFTPTIIPGCFLIDFGIFRDQRGSFIKTLRVSELRDRGLEENFPESFITTSKQNVLRGIHVQAPPSDHAKIVYCLAGSVMDVMIDLRAGSHVFQRSLTVDLSEGQGLYLPRGVAHGFFVRSEAATVGYHVSSEHDPDRDLGIRWNSIGVSWPIVNPVTSDRDATLPTLAEFSTPFEFHEFI